ncbi:hypothetical protein AB0K00_13285 [Dactylosporangium sp. NPDC049525]|uniref:hypothetical protein n=1 Tax=Dactylosporangium sp. NPDC049525 TaxID=3154730 RepID=UPI00342595F7
MTRQVKPGSKAYRAQVRDQLVALGFSQETISAQVAEHLIAECGTRPRTAWRLASELSLDLAAGRYNTLHGDRRAGMRGSRIWEFEQWPDRGVRPTLPTLRILATVYGTSWPALLDLRDLQQLPAADLAQYHATASAPARPLLVTPGPPATQAAAGTLTEAMLLTTTNVDAVELEDLWSDMNRAGDAYARASPDSVLHRLAVVRERARTLLHGRQRPKQTADLYLLSAKCSAMMAWISADLGRYHAAQELNAAAWLFGQHSDDALARRWVRTTQSRVEYWAGNGAESAWLAADGLSYKAGGSMTDAPLILAEARGWASVGAQQQVLDAIGRWARIEDATPVVADEDRFFNVSKDRRHFVAGASLLSVGRTELALRELQTARQAYTAMSQECRWDAMDPMIRIDTSRAYLRLGDLDGAAAELEPLLGAEVGPRPDMVRAELQVLRAELTGPRWRSSRAARSLADAVLDPHTDV